MLSFVAIPHHVSLCPLLHPTQASLFTASINKCGNDLVMLLRDSNGELEERGTSALSA